MIQSQSKSKHSLIFITVLLAAALFYGCNEAVTDPGPDNNDGGEFQLSESASSGTVSVWEAQNVMNVQEGFAEVITGSESLFEDSEGMVNTLADIQFEAARMRSIMQKTAVAEQLNPGNPDSLLFFEEWTLGQTAGRRALYYNSESGHARVYDVVYQFGEHLQIEYDSTEVRVDLAFTLEDDSDDRLLSVFKQTVFEPDYFILLVEARVEATDWDVSNEVTGATTSNTVNYGTQIDLVTLEQNGELNPDGSLALNELFTFNDQTTHSKEFNFAANNTGTFSEVWRDETTVGGAFDLLEPDNQASISRVIDFANHPELDRVEESATYVRNPSDSSHTGTLAVSVLYNSGVEETLSVEVDRFLEGGSWKEHYIAEHSNGTSFDFTVSFFDNYRDVEGEVITIEGYYVLFNATKYRDGSGEFNADVYESEAGYLAGDAPLLTIHLIFGGDGSGNGTISENGQSYDFEFGPDGDIEVSNDAGDSVTLNAY